MEVVMNALPVPVAFVLVVALGTATASAQAPATGLTPQQTSDDFLKFYAAGNPPDGRYEKFANPKELSANDFQKLFAQFDLNASYAGTLQPFWLRGRDEIGDLWARYFARYPDRRMIFRDRVFQSYNDNTSVETGYAEMYMGEDPFTSVVTFMRYSITRVRQDNEWKIVNMMVDRLPSEQPRPGTMPPWANTPTRSAAPPAAR